MLVGSLVSAVAPARADTPGFALDRFQPAARGSDWFASDSLDLRGRWRLSLGELIDWSYRPFTRGAGADAYRTYLEDQVIAHTGASLVVFEGFRISASMPVALYEHAAAGDASLGADVLLFGEYGRPARLGVGATAWFPTGIRERFTGDETFRGGPHALFAGDVGVLAYAASLAFAYRPHDATFAGRPLGSELGATFAAGFKVNDRVVFGPEASAATTLNAAALKGRATPVEFSFGMHVRIADDFQFGTSIGPGLTAGDGSPSMRVLALFEWAPDVCVDKDGDGICEPADACPELPGPRNRRRSQNGCPVPGVESAPENPLEQTPRERPDIDKPDKTDKTNKPDKPEPPKDQNVPTNPSDAPSN